jgi:hypothetical protein
MHPESFTLWCALLGVGIFGPLFVGGTVTCDAYFTVPNGEFFFSFPDGVAAVCCQTSPLVPHFSLLEF